MLELFLILEQIALHIVAGVTLCFLAIVIVVALFLFGLMVMELLHNLFCKKQVCKCDSNPKGEKD